ncbi:DUF2752 domain-containing protein [candidate division KSB1 bacterium]|nr:DUF2752 domain-containing protein [candidate division KSB1 bacterium]NIS27409.1 DUF2752 domain-containing protein [candidate division KSB1 bacterium]NIU28126.1 DUF2752 domain-containing protein [candidate division KSB1 bacterium]NIU90314.1 DUF2752 domain-containing protein [candidate division KSB1 bacterium]NIV92631.1 DUF2752 domain-containing protein [candidate division KSB1 bacterium]
MSYRLPALLTLSVLAILPTDGFGIVLCPFYRLVDLMCPACGLTRSMSAFLHFEFSKSLGYHPLGSLTVLFLLTVVVGIRPKIFWKKLNSRYSYLFGPVSVAVVFLTVWLVRVVF